MKWFIHDNDLHELPLGQEIIARLGWAGYGRAHALLETLTKLVPNDGKGIFQLPLAKPTDLGFWSRKFQQSEEETEQTFDVFEDARLIAPWRDNKVIYAPLLGERVDEYTKRKQKQLGDDDEPKGPSNGRRKKAKAAPDKLGSCAGDAEPKTASIADSQSYQDRNRNGHSQSYSHSYSSRHYRDIIPIDAQNKESKQENPNAEPQKQDGSKPSFPLLDMTVTQETVGSRFEMEQSHEEAIRLVSDGEFNLPALKSYDAVSELGDACCDAIREMKNQSFQGRVTCAEVMSRAMDILKLRGFDAPRGWLPVLKKLRTEGGPATAEAPEPFKPIRAKLEPERVLVDGSSALHFYEEPLKPFADLLVETAKYKGVPQSWAEAVPFLDCVIDGNIPHEELGAMIAVRDEIKSRIPARAAH